MLLCYKYGWIYLDKNLFALVPQWKQSNENENNTTEIMYRDNFNFRLSVICEWKFAHNNNNNDSNIDNKDY